MHSTGLCHLSALLSITYDCKFLRILCNVSKNRVQPLKSVSRFVLPWSRFSPRPGMHSGCPLSYQVLRLLGAGTSQLLRAIHGPAFWRSGPDCLGSGGNHVNLFACERCNGQWLSRKRVHVGASHKHRRRRQRQHHYVTSISEMPNNMKM